MAIIVPSILTRSPNELAEKIKRLEPLTDLIQIDIMDGRFVPNTSVSAVDVAEVHTSSRLEVHLMVEQPERYIADFVRAGAWRVVFHVEPVQDVPGLIAAARKIGAGVGVALNPETSATSAEGYLGRVDLVLVMSVHPGFQGRQFLPETLDKIRALKAMTPVPLVEIDGGMTPETAPQAIAAGADILNVGSFLFRNGKLESNWQAMQDIAAGK